MAVAPFTQPAPESSGSGIAGTYYNVTLGGPALNAADSETSMFTNTAVLPLSRSGERGIFAPAMRNAAEGAALHAAASVGSALDIAASASSRSSQ